MRAPPPISMLPCLLLWLSGCATDSSRYPSLAPRPIEKLGFAEPVVAPVVAAPDAALDAKLAATGRQADAIAEGFARDARKAETAAVAARGQPAGTERWITAQAALATLDDWRAQMSALLTDVEQLAIDRAATLAPEYPGIAKARDRATAEAEAESATITRLTSLLPQG